MSQRGRQRQTRRSRSRIDKKNVTDASQKKQRQQQQHQHQQRSPRFPRLWQCQSPLCRTLQFITSWRITRSCHLGALRCWIGGLVGESIESASLHLSSFSFRSPFFRAPHLRPNKDVMHAPASHPLSDVGRTVRKALRQAIRLSLALPTISVHRAFFTFFFWFWIFSPPPRLSIFSIFFCFRVSPPLCFATCCGLCLGPLLSLFLFWLLFERDSTCNPLQLSAFCLLLPRTLASDGLTFTTFCGSPFTLWLAWCGRSALFVRLGLSAGPLARFPAQAMPCFSMPCHAMTNLSCSAWKQQKGEVHRLGHCLGHCACVWWI